MTTPIDPNEPHLIDASAAELNALLEIIMRAPQTRGETLFVESIFARWHSRVAPSAADQTSTPAPPG